MPIVFLPLDLAKRADTEVTVFLITWLVVFLLSLVVRPNKLWLALLAISGTGLCLLPLFDFWLNSHWLTQAIEHRNWLYLGVDISFVISGALLLFIMKYVKNRTAKVAEHHKPILQWIGRYAD